MGGAPGLARVDDDIIYEDPQHFLYTVRLDDGRKITVRNKGEFAVGACATLWLKVDPQSREGHYPLNFNDIQAGSGCKASAQSGPHK